MQAAQTVDAYIAQYPEAVQVLLQTVRQTIREAAPHAQERIAYGIPTYFDGENVIHFGAAKHHIGLYPTSSGVEAFADRLTGYRTSRGAIQFPLNQPIPYALIREITLFRVQEAAAHQAAQPRRK